MRARQCEEWNFLKQEIRLIHRPATSSSPWGTAVGREGVAKPPLALSQPRGALQTSGVDKKDARLYIFCSVLDSLCSLRVHIRRGEELRELTPKLAFASRQAHTITHYSERCCQPHVLTHIMRNFDNYTLSWMLVQLLIHLSYNHNFWLALQSIRNL